MWRSRLSSCGVQSFAGLSATTRAYFFTEAYLDKSANSLTACEIFVLGHDPGIGRGELTQLPSFTDLYTVARLGRPRLLLSYHGTLGHDRGNTEGNSGFRNMRLSAVDVDQKKPSLNRQPP
jgi:hypothetical protein